jgi:spore maturation protein CgeB
VLDDADVVLIHEWNESDLVAGVGRLKDRFGYLLFFLDAHHRALSAPDAIGTLDLDAYDAVLAFGEALRDIYRRRGWGRRALTWHEAADTALFRPAGESEKDHDLLWVGNWGDDERSEELVEFLIEPVRRLQLRSCIHGVRYPDHARAMLAQAGIQYGGWLANHRVPAAFARAKATVHVPRSAYRSVLPGIPTIRVFEALACGIPLVCSPWLDEEGLFPPGCYLQVADGRAMRSALRAVLSDRDMAREMSLQGLAAIQRAHTCRHRVEQLLAIVASLSVAAHPPVHAMETPA